MEGTKSCNCCSAGHILLMDAIDDGQNGCMLNASIALQ